MSALQSKDDETWDFFLDENLSVSKSLVSFFSTGVDQALEQEIKSTKIEGRMRGVGTSESALKEHFLISCEMRQITEAFLESLHLNSAEIERTITNWSGQLTRDLRTMLESWKK